MIAHRQSTVLPADRIVALSRGGAEAVSRPAELLSDNEIDGRLPRLQFSETRPLGRL